MHDVKHFIEQTDEVKKNLVRRGLDPNLADEIIAINSRRKNLTTRVETAKSEINQLSKQIGEIKKNKGDAQRLIEEVSRLKQSISSDQEALDLVQSEIRSRLEIIPNFLSSEVPNGVSEDDNVEVFRSGNVPSFSFTPKEHVEIGENLKMLDFDKAASLTGSRFVVYKGLLARLERALINFMLDVHTGAGYEEIIPPFIVNDQAMYGTGQLPKFKDDLFKLEGKDWFLIPTSEVPVTNLKRDEILDYKSFPYKYTSYTPCFRSEAGSYGKDTKGLIRLHQFNKVELVQITLPEQSEQAHGEMITRARLILDKLKLPYRGLMLCSGDIGFSSMKTIDLEVWLPGQNKYREISSISNCGPFQARRASIRFRAADGKIDYAHTLNGSGLAVGRTLVAILENYQQEDGSIIVPDALVGYMGGIKVIKQ